MLHSHLHFRLFSLLCFLSIEIRGACYPGMPCYNVESETKSPQVTKLKLPNYMIPIWKQRLYDTGNNGSYAELVSTFDEGGPESVLVAYQGCKIINVLSNHKREVFIFFPCPAFGKTSRLQVSKILIKLFS